MLDRRRLLAHRSVDGKHPAAERGRAPRDFAADVAEPDDADGLAADLPRTAPPTIGLQDHDPSRNDVAISNRRCRRASIIMIANSPSAGSWPYALHRVTPLGSEETSMPSVPASGTCSKRSFGAAGNPLRQTPVSSTSVSASAAAACAGSLLSKDLGTDVGSDELDDWRSL